MEKQSKTYLRVVGIEFLMIFLGIIVMNFILNPYFVFGVGEDDVLVQYKHAIASRKGKAELLRQQPFEVLILGTSRAEIGLNPDDIQWTRAFNGALGGCSLSEAEAMFNLAIQHHELKQVIIVCDLVLANGRNKDKAEVEASRLNPELSMGAYYFQSLFGFDATEKSIDMIRYAIRDEPTQWNLYGHKFEADYTERSMRSMFDRALWGYTHSTGIYASLLYDVETLSRIRSMLTTCSENGIEMILIIPPIHAEFQHALYVLDKWKVFEQFKIDLLDIASTHPDSASLWDFSGFTIYTTEELPEEDWSKANTMQWYIEPSHFKSPLGNIMLDSIAGKKEGGTFGLRLTQKNIDGHLTAVREDMLEWRDKHPKEIERLHLIRNGSHRPPKVPAVE